MYYSFNFNTQETVKQKGGTSVGHLVTVASVCKLPVPYSDGLDILAAIFLAFFRCANASKLSVSGGLAH